MNDKNKPEAKPAEQLVFSDDFMFGAVMRDEEICRGALECLLGEKISQVEYSEPQKTIEPLYGPHGIRLDVYVEDDKTAYDVEIQNRDTKDLGKRTRYYQGLMDVDCLLRGEEYTKLKRSIIIFLCRFDPYKRGIPCYTIRRKCEQDEAVEIEDDAVVHVFNCRAYAREKNPELRAFLKYVMKNKAESDLTRRIENMVAKKKILEGWSYTAMRQYLYELELKAEGKAEGENERALSTARNMLAMGLGTPGQIAQATGLSLEEVEKLAKEPR